MIIGQGPPPPSYADAVKRTAPTAALIVAAAATGSGAATDVSNTTSATATELTQLLPSTRPSTHRHYFTPLLQSKYWASAFHLTIINFPFALLAWLYLFLGVLVGTTLLLTLPLGTLIWWLTLIGSRSFANMEISLQTKFHGVSSLASPRPIFHRRRQPIPSDALLESGVQAQALENQLETSFLKNTYAMFLDPSSYQPIFYFLVVKSSITLLLTPLILVIVPTALVLVIPAPPVLQLVHTIGIWQAKIALDGLVA